MEAFFGDEPAKQVGCTHALSILLPCEGHLKERISRSLGRRTNYRSHSACHFVGLSIEAVNVLKVIARCESAVAR